MISGSGKSKKSHSIFVLLQTSVSDPGTCSHDSVSYFHSADGHEFGSNLTCSYCHLKCSELTQMKFATCQ